MHKSFMKIIVDVNLAIITIDTNKTRMHILPFALPEK
jgi:hypothetical protein